MASLRNRLWDSPAAGAAKSVPNVHRQGASRALSIAAFASPQSFKLARIVTFTHPLFQVHHPGGVG